MDPSTTLKKLKEQAELNSIKKLQSLFNTPDQLEQIQQHLNRIEKKKNIVEAQLKSAIQSHFNSVNSCMVQLQEVNHDLDNVRNTIYSIEDEYKTISHLETTLHELRQEAYRHKQLKSAKENMKNILDVDELARKARMHLEKNELLFTHKYLVELEKCRNDILMELGDPTETNLNDIHLVDEFFKDVKDIQKSLQTQVFVVIDRMLTVVRKEPKQLVTSLRIIEREEILDEDWRKKKLETRFMPSDRPKKWKEKCFAEIKKFIEYRVQGSRLKERDEDDSWFSKHLSNINGILVKDLEIVKKLCDPCFPPSYKIFDYFVDTVHNVLSAHVVELLETDQLQKQEFFILLSYLDTYKSKSLMGHPSLKLDKSKIKDLLNEKQFNFVLNKHMEYTQERMPKWLQNALDKNAAEWLIFETKPKINHEGYYESSMPDDINTMFSQQLSLIEEVKDERFSKAILKLLIDLFDEFVFKLKEKLTELRNNHFKNTEILKDTFVKRLITISNDCFKMGDNVIQIRVKYDKFIDKDEIGGPNDNYQNLANSLANIASLCIDYIVEDMATYLTSYFKNLLTREWLNNDNAVEVILCTTKDYLDDFLHLKRDLSTEVLYKWHIKIKLEFIKGFLQNLSSNRLFQKFACSDSAERIKFANKVEKDISNVERFFKDLEPHDRAFDFSILHLMRKTIKNDDKDFIGVEIGALNKKAPELNSDMIYALVSLRGDITKNDFKDNYEGYILDEKQVIANAGGKFKPDEAILMFKKELNK